MPDSTLILTLGLLAFTGLRSRWTGRLVVLLLLSPILRYGLAIFGFAIRLHLSDWAGSLLRWGGLPVQTEGNVLVQSEPGAGRIEMAVDPACMGLHLTGLSVLVAIFWLIWHERQRNRQTPVGWMLVYGAVALLLTVACNLFRIMLLVGFRLGPGTLLHDGLGLACVIVYAWLPAWWLAQWTVGRFGTDPVAAPVRRSAGWSIALLLVGFGLMAFTVKPTVGSGQHQKLLTHYKGQGFVVRTSTTDGFYQLTRPGWLLYLKPLPDWWSPEHSPVVCWRGGGYEIRRIQERTVAGKVVYMAELRHATRPTLYTTWWFTNGQHHTIEQLDFRWRMARGQSGFALVNVTAEKPLTTHQIASLIR